MCIEENTGIASAPDKWKLQETARRLLPNERITACHTVVSNMETGVSIRADSKKAWFGGLAVCGSTWICSVCARKIAEHRREELQSAVDSAIGQGLDVAMITLTFSHGIKDKLSDILPKLSKATRRLKSGRAWQKVKDKYSIVGSVRALEVTHGRNGWHPHTHEIEFFKTPLSIKQRAELQFDIFKLWLAACGKEGLPLPNEKHGVDVRGASNAAQYVGKWGFASELTRSTTKTAWSGRNPWQLLEDYHYGDKQAGALFVEYAKHFKGKRQLYWSKGLRDLLSIGELFDDETLAECDDVSDQEEVVTIMSIPADTWAVVCRTRSRGKVLKLAYESVHELEGYLDYITEKIPIRWMKDDLAVNGKMQRALSF